MARHFRGGEGAVTMAVRRDGWNLRRTFKRPSGTRQVCPLPGAESAGLFSDFPRADCLSG